MTSSFTSPLRPNTAAVLKIFVSFLVAVAIVNWLLRVTATSLGQITFATDSMGQSRVRTCRHLARTSQATTIATEKWRDDLCRAEAEGRLGGAVGYEDLP